jgi:hypothetical protein
MERTLKNEKYRLQKLSERDEEGKNLNKFFYPKLFPCSLLGPNPRVNHVIFFQDLYFTVTIDKILIDTILLVFGHIIQHEM